jgi:phenylacetate-coenzyme A ligase PaaK-like adenylate-forming protein
MADRFLRFKRGKSSCDVERVLGFLIRSCYRSVPLYRRLLDERQVLPHLIRSAADLPRLPIMERDEVFRGGLLRDRIHARADAARCVRTSTIAEM